MGQKESDWNYANFNYQEFREIELYKTIFR